jgi:hypothetical protein
MYRKLLVINLMNNGVLNGIKAMPQKDSTSDNTSTFSMGRYSFMNTFSLNNNSNTANTKKWIGGNRDASQVIARNRNNQIGSGSVNAVNENMAFTTHKDVNVVNDALRRARSGGSVAPIKKAYSPSSTYMPTSRYTPILDAKSKPLYGIKRPVLSH